jgi:hypothetical protein
VLPGLDGQGLDKSVCPESDLPADALVHPAAGTAAERQMPDFADAAVPVLRPDQGGAALPAVEPVDPPKDDLPEAQLLNQVLA